MSSCNPLKIVLRLLTVFLLVGGGAVVAQESKSPEAAQIDAARYPALSDIELGEVRRIVALSRLLPGDWSGMGDDVWHAAERTQQFQLQYMAVALALVQYQYTPAYRELYQKAMDSLIQKMTLPDIWQSWIQSSRGGTAAYGGIPADVGTGDLEAGWLDPVVRYNIMLKGPLLQVATLYDMLYRDGKYDRPDAFTFRYSAGTWGNGPVVFRYSLPDLAGIVNQEYVDANYEGVQCEPNRIFPQCNQPPILGLMLFDHTHGTHYSMDVMPKFALAWQRLNYTDPVTHKNVAYRLVKQNATGPGGMLGDAWAGSWMNAWNSNLMREIYPPQRDMYLPALLSGDYARKVPEYAGKDLLSLEFGLFAFMAAEMNDQTAKQALLAYADKNFNPTWQDGEYYYPRSLDYATDEHGNSHGVSSWTGNVLLALARLDTGSSLADMYRNPWNDAEIGSPTITNVDDLMVSVVQAFYDSQRNALIVTLKPGPAHGERTHFTISGLKAATRYEILRDGTRSGEMTAGHDGTVEISTQIDRPHSLIVVAR
jgi:hypothetical protein